MTDFSAKDLSPGDCKSRRRTEIITFFVLAFGIWPVVAIGVVASYGFLIWMSQIIFGPPGPLGH